MAELLITVRIWDHRQPISPENAVAAAGGTAQNSYFGQYRGGLSCGDGRSPTETIRFLSLEELARLFAVARASPRDRALFLIAYRHGLRASGGRVSGRVARGE